MKLLSFRLDAACRPGVLLGDAVLDLSTIGAAEWPRDLLGIVQAGDAGLERIRAAIAAGEGQRYALADLQVTAPLAQPPKVIGIGLNYRDHAAECGAQVPAVPIIFAKFPSSITGPYAAVRWPAELTQQVDYEVELGVVIGSVARRVRAADALEHVFGYLVVNDLSARDLQLSSSAGQWDWGKGLDGFCPCGPYLVTRDEVADPQVLALECRVNGRVLQQSNTANMVFGVRELLEYISRGITLHSGDIIATGTPAGVGMSRQPRRFLQHGDECVCEIEGLGSLCNKMTVE